MKRNLAIILLCVTLILGCNKKGNPVGANNSPGGNLTSLEESVVASGNAFGFKLFSKVNDAELNKNVFISPFSVSMAFGMILNGANGPTLDSLEQVLGDAGLSLGDINNSYKNISNVLTNLDATVAFQIANSIWYRFGFSVLPKFLNDNRNYFNAEIDSLDFTQSSAVQTINGWVDTKTSGKIPKVLDNIPPSVVMYVINAIYFKGPWTRPFDSSATVNAPFHCSDGSIITCKLMYQKSKFLYYEDTVLQAIDLPYGNRFFSMTIILPKADISIDQFVTALTRDQWNTIVGKLDSSEVALSLPKFKLSYSRTLNDELKAMGMGIAFDNRADFSHISQSDKFYISYVLHKTFVEVDEKGTEAAAVTVIGGPLIGPAIMHIDHPFIFAIREHQSGTILFIGKIVNPVAQ